jgi:hypothetical protein
MTHAIVAIDHSHGGAFCDDPNVGVGVDASRQNAFDVLRQTNHAMAVRALQVGAGHQRRDFGGVLIWQASTSKSAEDKDAKLLSTDQDGCVTCSHQIILGFKLLPSKK